MLSFFRYVECRSGAYTLAVVIGCSHTSRPIELLVRWTPIASRLQSYSGAIKRRRLRDAVVLSACPALISLTASPITPATAASGNCLRQLEVGAGA